ncbi:MAG: HisA/HisF-related TIM barrel protein [Actinomycetota bacterium]|nr:HisA/HisF-related TIM barrel protein [Actinomycetota bacterium]
MQLIPAVDLLDGSAVRLVQGDFDRRTGYGDPVALARRWVDAGARWVHVVDLDAARSGLPVNRWIVRQVVEAVAPVPVQAGGGVRGVEDVEDLLASGVTRVVMGTVAARRPSLALSMAEKFPRQVAVGIDHRHGQVAVEGWAHGASMSVADLLDRFADAPFGAVVVTAIERDGMLSGPDLDGLRAVLRTTALPVVASGGVGSAEHLRALADLEVAGRRLAGAIVGKALVEGVLEVREAMAACEPSE